MKPTITSFQSTYGRPFAARAALRYAKIDINDVRLGRSAFVDNYKHDPKKAPLGKLPVLELNGITFVQTTALARWAARKTDLYPTDDLEQLIVDETLESMNEMIEKVGFDSNPDVKKQQRETFLKEILPKYMNLLGERIKRSGGPFILGKKLTIADIAIYGNLKMFYTGNLDHVPVDIIPKEYPLVDALFTEAEKHPIIRAEVDNQAPSGA